MEELGLGLIEMEEVVEALHLIVLMKLSLILSVPLLIESLELLQLEVGIECPVLETEFNQVRFLVTPCWLRLVWEFTSFYKLKLYVPEAEYPTSTITNNHSIIKKALSLQRFTKQEM